MEKSFDDLGISPPILKALQEMGYKAPTGVQSQAIPHVLNREDVIVMSKTGSGKTAVFGVPLLQMTDARAVGPQGLILAPTRELAVQVDSDLKQMAQHLQHKTTAVYGQHNINAEIQALKKNVAIVTGTPGRVLDHISHGNLKTKHIRFLVLDEADRMLDMGFVDQVERIIRTLPGNRVTLLFSATIPAEIHKICRKYMKNPVTVEIESETMTVDTIEQVYYRVQEKEKNLQLNRLLLLEQPESCVIFCNTRFMVDRVQRYLLRKGYACRALHGDIPQNTRLKTLERFKQGEFHLLVATDVAARGIHIDDLSLVINYDVPIEKDSYVHRIGRTGRAGNVGRAISLVTGEDIMTLYEIEEHIGVLIEEMELPTEADINKCRAAADKWIEENSPKKQQSFAADAQSNLNKNKKQPSPPQPAQYPQQDRQRRREVTKDYNTTRVNSKPVTKQEKPDPAVSKPAPEKAREINTVPANPSIGNEHTQDKPKKTLYRRFIQRLLGR
ncbi:RNA helicase, DEAD-box type, Q motif [Syntrophomonas zehnderi OL-4]|uniref:RNA helicase, DEAD-box type, Q motif n=1 Tax=Syntrophomonas zehnderi OL-4 TaxID=690567 RepID=A0A0E3W3K2_9FIRM|nr:DEAD/DEAH box helicase [Syntrophomonas zehnderi]CFX88809.1 RNA helicase, DEAD-box type, Q motif [Syntrophomonas zehnderi OL-4]